MLSWWKVKRVKSEEWRVEFFQSEEWRVESGVFFGVESGVFFRSKEFLVIGGHSEQAAETGKDPEDGI